MGLLGKKKEEEINISYKELREEQKKLKKEGKLLETKEEKMLRLKEERETVKKLRVERKSLRKDLKKQGIKKRNEFEAFAQQVGMGYPVGSTEASLALIGAKASTMWATVTASFSLIKALIAVIIILGLTLYTAWVTEEKGHFTVNITQDMLEDGFEISETADFTSSETRLYATELQNSNATSIYEISREVGMMDGSHNGPGYMAYTFYLKNAGINPTDYAYTVNILSETLNTAAATWLMFYEDDHQIIYAKQQENGEAENLWGYREAPFSEEAYNQKDQYYKYQGLYGIVTTPFVDDYTALQGYVENIEPGEVKKYTIVIWLEGDDPDCNNSILGGHVGFNIQFDRIGPERDDFFKGLFRQEYDKTYMVEDIPEIDNGNAGTGVRDNAANNQQYAASQSNAAKKKNSQTG